MVTGSLAFRDGSIAWGCCAIALAAAPGPRFIACVAPGESYHARVAEVIPTSCSEKLRDPGAAAGHLTWQPPRVQI